MNKWYRFIEALDKCEPVSSSPAGLLADALRRAPAVNPSVGLVGMVLTQLTTGDQLKGPRETAIEAHQLLNRLHVTVHGLEAVA